MSKRNMLWYRAATFSAILFFLAALVTSGAIYQRQQQVEYKMLENLLWAAYQYDREVRELRFALHDARPHRLEELLLRFEIVLSRDTLLGRGELRRAVESTPIQPYLLAAGQLVQEMSALMDGLEDGSLLLDQETRSRLGSHLISLQSATSTLLLDTNAHVATLKSAERQALLRLYGVVLGLITLLMISGIVLVYALIREGREHARKSRMLEEQAKALDKAASKAQAASKAKSEFMAVMSHEIRTPLNGIVGVADLLADESLSPYGRGLLQSLDESVLGLQTVINDVIDYTKFESGSLDLNSSPFDIRSFITQLSRSYQLQAEKKGIDFRATVAEEVPGYLEGDTGRLRQVLMNLLNNAIKFTEDGAIHLKVFMTSSGQVGFSVRDTGCGIPEQSRSSLFKPFSQVDSSISRRYGGSGLGLAICARLVTAMEGQISFSSHVGLGSLFWFNVPLTEVSAERMEAFDGQGAVSSRSDDRLSPSRILVVEDNQTNQELVKTMLERQGHRVRLASNGQAALRMLKEEQHDLVLMDMQMPVMDGLETTRRWREFEASRHQRLPIVAMTANAMPSDRQRCLEAGMDDVLCKPFTRPELRRILAKFLSAAEEDLPCREYGEVPGQSTSRSLAEDSQLINKTLLQELAKDLGDVSLKTLVERFLERLAERQSRMLTSLELHDRAELVESAHSLKGAAASLGCLALADSATALERYIKEERSFETLKNEVQRIEQLGKQTHEQFHACGYVSALRV